MDIIDTSRLQTAVYWSPRGRDDHSHPIYDDPRELTPGIGTGGVRWVDTFQLILGKGGEQISSSSTVATGEDVEEGGVLWLGSLSDIPVGDHRRNPFLNKNALVIQRFSKVPTLDATQFYRVAFL